MNEDKLRDDILDLFVGYTPNEVWPALMECVQGILALSFKRLPGDKHMQFLQSVQDELNSIIPKFLEKYKDSETNLNDK